MIKTLNPTGKYLSQGLIDVEVNQSENAARNGFDFIAYLRNFEGSNLGFGAWTK